MNRSIKAYWLCLAASLISLAGTPADAAQRFEFKEPQQVAYRVDESLPVLRSAMAPERLRAVSDDGYQRPVTLCRQIMVQVRPGADFQGMIAGTSLTVIENVKANFYLLEAPDAWQAAAEADRLAKEDAVLVSVPDMHRALKLHSSYAKQPNDPLFIDQFHLENRDTNGTRLGPGMNARRAWPEATGSGITISIADIGVNTNHLDLTNALVGSPHFNFLIGTEQGGPASQTTSHGTAVAGLAGARLNNHEGGSGMAPGASLASWVIFGQFGAVANGSQLRDMFQYRSNTVWVQNHSWSFSDVGQVAPLPIVEVGISNAITFGRGGKGSIMVRSAGNDRRLFINANDDGYTRDPRIITVGALRSDGLFSSYSNPGACLLLSAPSGDQDNGFPGLTTTALNGGYLTGANQFSGTSASSPLVAGLAAMILELRPDLTYRDMQQLMILSAQYPWKEDVNRSTNQAGLKVSHNFGYGVPDAGRALAIARNWPLRPAATNVSFVFTNLVQIPNEGLRVEVLGENVSSQLASIRAVPGRGPHPRDLTPFFPVVDVGLATNTIAEDLNGKVALISRGINTFAEKIELATEAGARMAIIANHPDDNVGLIMGETDYAQIPSMLIRGEDGMALRNYMETNGPVEVRTLLLAAQYSTNVTRSLLCEHVAVRVQQFTSSRGNLRITVTSPSGTRSVLQDLSNDFNGGPNNWTYYSTHHFFESSQGTWTVQFSDEIAPAFGNVTGIELILYGTEILDEDGDGLDDDWERTHFQHLANGPRDDADGDGDSNMLEQLRGTDPNQVSYLFSVHGSMWSQDRYRLGWTSLTNRQYEVYSTTDLNKPLQPISTVPGSLYESELFVPVSEEEQEFFMIRSVDSEAP